MLARMLGWMIRLSYACRVSELDLCVTFDVCRTDG
jgi:hypothetical protein